MGINPAETKGRLLAEASIWPEIIGLRARTESGRLGRGGNGIRLAILRVSLRGPGESCARATGSR